jgi:hypothetical protein
VPGDGVGLRRYADTAAIDHLASAKLSRMTARRVWGSKW